MFLYYFLAGGIGVDLWDVFFLTLFSENVNYCCGLHFMYYLYFVPFYIYKFTNYFRLSLTFIVGEQCIQTPELPRVLAGF
jgi:hypothetical protein